MDEITHQPEPIWLDHLYHNLSALLENLKMIEKNTNDHQTRLQLTTQQRAIALDLLEIKERIDVLENKKG